MKFVKAIIFCLLLCFEIVFSQDSTSVHLDSLSQDPPPQDTSSIDSVKIKRGLHFFASAGVQLTNFKERSKFQGLLDEQFDKYMDDYYSESSTGYVVPEKQNFQIVNLAFPLTAGIIWQFNEIHAIGLGTGFLYDKETIIIKNKRSEFKNLSYTLQGFPAFIEYRLGISESLISMKNVDYFSLLLRYYWMLPGTEIYSSDWGNAKADFDPLGNGFGIFLGYCFLKWEAFEIWGEMGYSSIDVKSSDENAILNSWNLGGISVMVRAVF